MSRIPYACAVDTMTNVMFCTHLDISHAFSVVQIILVIVIVFWI